MASLITSGYVPCSIPGCIDRNSSRHSFPNPEKDKNRFDEWMRLISNPKLENLDAMRIYRSYRVCHQHFTDADVLSNNRLNKTAIPSKKLPGNAGKKQY